MLWWRTRGGGKAFRRRYITFMKSKYFENRKRPSSEVLLPHSTVGHEFMWTSRSPFSLSSVSPCRLWAPLTTTYRVINMVNNMVSWWVVVCKNIVDIMEDASWYPRCSCRRRRYFMISTMFLQTTTSNCCFRLKVQPLSATLQAKQGQAVSADVNDVGV